MAAAAQAVAAIAAMHISNDARAPVLGWRRGHPSPSELKLLPPAQFHDALKAEIEDQIGDIGRHDEQRRAATA